MVAEEVKRLGEGNIEPKAEMQASDIDDSANTRALLVVIFVFWAEQYAVYLVEAAETFFPTMTGQSLLSGGLMPMSYVWRVIAIRIYRVEIDHIKLSSFRYIHVWRELGNRR